MDWSEHSSNDIISNIKRLIHEIEEKSKSSFIDLPIYMSEEMLLYCIRSNFYKIEDIEWQSLEYKQKILRLLNIN